LKILGSDWVGKGRRKRRPMSTKHRQKKLMIAISFPERGVGALSCDLSTNNKRQRGSAQ